METTKQKNIPFFCFAYFQKKEKIAKMICRKYANFICKKKTAFLS